MLTSFYLSHNQDILPQWHNISILLYSITFINAFFTELHTYWFQYITKRKWKRNHYAFSWEW